MKRQIFTLIFLFLGIFALQAQPEIVKLWTETYTWNTGDACRDATVFDGKFYVARNANNIIRVIDGATGNELESEAITGANNSFTIAVDDAGKLVVPLNAGGGVAWALKTVDIATNTITPITGWAGDVPARVDYIDVRGNTGSAEKPAYIIGTSSAGAIHVWEIANGAGTANPATFTRTQAQAGGTGGDIKWIDDTHFLSTGQSRVPTIMTVDFSADPFITEVTPIGSATIDCGGGDVFNLGGIPYLAAPNGRLGAIDIFDITNPAAPKKVVATTAAVGSAGNGGIHVAINAVKTADNEATIYVWAPNNGATAYKAEAVKMPVLTPEPGFYTGETLEVTISCDTEDAEIRYTLDGSTPDEDSELYTGDPIELNDGVTEIKILVTKDGLFDCVLVETYQFNEECETPFTVTFDANGGSDEPDAVEADCETEIEEPEDIPSLECYSFSGWYKEAECTNAWDFENDVVRKDITLYAKWTVVQKTVTFDSQGGSDVPPGDADCGGTVAKPATDPTSTEPGAVFGGWYKDEECTNAWDFDNDVVTEDLTLYAKWSVYVTVTLMSNDAELDKIEDQIKGAKFEQPEDPELEGYAFLGWFTDEELETEYDFDELVEEDLILYAKWVKTWVVTFDNEGDETDVVVEDGEKVKKPANPVWLGHTFEGWFTEEDEEWDFDDAVTEDITLTAIWTVDHYTVTFDSRGGTPVEPQEDLLYGEKLVEPEEPVLEGGYEFLGWFSTAEGGLLWDFENGEVKGDMTLFAHWKAEFISITSHDPQGEQQWTLRPIVRIEFDRPLDDVSDDVLTVTDKDGAPVDGTFSYMEVATGKSVIHYIFDEDLNPNETYTVTLSADVTGEEYAFDFIPRERKVKEGANELIHDLTALTGFSMTQDAACIVLAEGLDANGTLAAIPSASDLTPSADITGSTKWTWTWKPGLVTSTSSSIQSQRTYLRYHNATLYGQANRSKDGQFQFYLFGDGSNCKAGLTLFNGAAYFCQDVEVDWVGWKLITWDMKNDTKTYLNWITGTWGGTPAPLTSVGARVAGFTAITAADPEKVWYGENTLYFSDIRYLQFDDIIVTFDSNGGSAVAEGAVPYAGTTVARPADPTKLGNEFVGWFTEEDVEWDFDAPVTDDMTLTAKWNVTSMIFTVTFDPANGAAETEVNVEDGETVAKPANPTLLGYTFEGWFTEEDEEWDFDEDVVTDDITLTAKWSQDHYTVTFNVCGGTPLVEPQEDLLYGDKVEEPVEITREGGYDFLGWFTAIEMGLKWDFDNDEVTGNMTLFAQWKSDYLRVASYSPVVAEQISDRPIVRIQFNAELDEETIADDQIVVTGADGEPVEGVQTYMAINGKSVFHFYFNEDLNSGEEYTVTLAAEGIVSFEGDEMAEDFVFTFTPRHQVVIEKVALDNFTNTARPLNLTAGSPVGFYRPTASGAAQTAGVVREPSTPPDAPTHGYWDTEILPTVESTASLRMAYQWDENYDGFTLVDNVLTAVQPQIRWHYTADATTTTFAKDNVIRYYLFGDGSYSQFSIQVYSAPTLYTVNNVTVDWVGWKLISWDLANDVAEGYLVNAGPQTFPETGLRFNGCHTMSPPASQRNFAPSALWASELHLVKLGAIEGAIKVTFETGFGAKIPNDYIDEGATLPAKYFSIDNLEGWYLDAAFTEAWLQTDLVTEDITLYAKWANVWTVEFESEGAVVETYENVPDNVAVPAPENPVREGYAFDGWFTEEEDGEKWDFATGKVTEDLTLYAQWVKTWVVTFDTNGGKAEVNPQIVREGATVTKPPVDTDYSGHTFVQWNLEGDEYEFSTPVTGDITLVAEWSLNNVEVVIHFNIPGVANEIIVISWGETIDKPADPERGCYEFGGWFANGGLSMPFDFDAPINALTDVYAKWNSIMYTVSFDSQGGPDVASKSVACGDILSLPDDPLRSGWNFGGWFTETELVNVYDEDSFVEGDFTLFAKWTPGGNRTIDFDPQGGVCSEEYITVPYGTKAPKPDDPTKAGSTFGGWFTEAECINEYDFDEPLTANITVYAKWTVSAHTVTFNTQGGSTVANATVENGAKVTKPADPTKAGSTFGGWYKEAACTNAWNFDTDVVTAPTTLYAKWGPATGYETISAANALIYPNPSNGLFVLEFDNEGDYIVTVTDVAGKVLLRQTTSDKVTQMDISSYPAGVYFVIIENGAEKSVKRIVKN